MLPTRRRAGRAVLVYNVLSPGTSPAAGQGQDPRCPAPREGMGMRTRRGCGLGELWPELCGV